MSILQEKFKAIADKIREKTGETNLIKPNDFVNKIDDVYKAGGKVSYVPMEYNMQKNTISVSNAIPDMPLLNYQIWGNCIQETQPTRDNPQELICVGDLITDETSGYYGKYKIPYTFNGTEYAVYLSEPLRGIVGYGLHSDTNTYYSDYYMDYIDFKTQKIVRNVKELTISDMSSLPEVGITCYTENNMVYARCQKTYNDMILTHPDGNTQDGNILSNYLQRNIRRSKINKCTSHFATSVNTYNSIYFYWNLSELGLTTEGSDSTDYLLSTNDSPAKYYKVKDADGVYLTSLSQINEKIAEYYSGITIKMYYPLKESTYEDIVLDELTTSETGAINISVNTELSPYKIHLEYYTDKETAGRNAEWNVFWDNFQNNGKSNSFQNQFSGDWNETTLIPKYDVIPISGVRIMNGCTGIQKNISDVFEDAGVKLDFSKCENFNEAFAQPGIVGIGTIDTRNATVVNNLFTWNNTIKEIRELILKDDGSQTIGAYCFTGVNSLKTINIVGTIGDNITVSSRVLTKESIISIVNALSPTATGKTLTLYRDAVNSAFETSTGAKNGSTSDEWLALTGTKSNWTITLS